MEGLEPAHLSAPDPKSGVSTNFTTSAIIFQSIETACFNPVFGSAKIIYYFKNGKNLQKKIACLHKMWKSLSKTCRKRTKKQLNL
jgi:hypothetical protein